ncbi:MAG: beta strand repeat-containing protein, partial [Planctomycetia bacterium]
MVLTTSNGANGTITTGTMSLANVGNVTLDATGQITLKGSVTGILNSFQQKNASQVLIGFSGVGGSAVTLSNSNGSSTGFQFASPVRLAQNAIFNTSVGTSVIFSSTIDSDANNALKSLLITSDNGQFTFGGNIGATAGAGSLQSFNIVPSTGSLTVGNGQVTFDTGVSNINTAGGVSIKFNTILKSSSATFKDSSSAIQFSGDVSGQTPLTSNLIFDTPSSISVGSLGQNATGTGASLKDISFLATTNNPLSFIAGAISAQSISTPGSVRFGGNFQVTGTQTYTDAGGAAGDNDINIQSVGNISLSTISAVNDITLNTTGTGQITLGNANATGAASLAHNGILSFTGTNFTADSLSETSTLSSNVVFGPTVGEVLVQLTTGNFLLNNNALLGSDVRVKTLSANGTVQFSGLVDSSSAIRRNLSIDSRSTLTFSKNLGATNRLGAVAVNSGNSQVLQGLVSNGTIRASSFDSGVVANDISMLQSQDYDTAAGLNLT